MNYKELVEKLQPFARDYGDDKVEIKVRSTEGYIAFYADVMEVDDNGEIVIEAKQ